MVRAGFVSRFLLVGALLVVAVAAAAQSGSAAAVPAAKDASAAQSFDVNAAVEAYLAKMPPAERARSKL